MNERTRILHVVYVRQGNRRRVDPRRERWVDDAWEAVHDRPQLRIWKLEREVHGVEEGERRAERVPCRDDVGGAELSHRLLHRGEDEGRGSEARSAVTDEERLCRTDLACSFRKPMCPWNAGSRPGKS
jgi:hypothetical protein